MGDIAHSICLIKLYQITMRKNFDFLFLTTLILQNRNFAIQDGSMQLDRTTLDQLDQVYD